MSERVACEECRYCYNRRWEPGRRVCLRTLEVDSWRNVARVRLCRAVNADGRCREFKAMPRRAMEGLRERLGVGKGE